MVGLILEKGKKAPASEWINTFSCVELQTFSKQCDYFSQNSKPEIILKPVLPLNGLPPVQPNHWRVYVGEVQTCYKSSFQSNPDLHAKPYTTEVFHQRSMKYIKYFVDLLKLSLEFNVVQTFIFLVG